MRSLQVVIPVLAYALGVALIGCSSEPSVPNFDEPMAEDPSTATKDVPLEGSEDTSPDDAGIPAMPEMAVGTQFRVLAELNLRAEPNSDSAILRVIPAGATVKLGDPSMTAGWTHIEHDGVRGWGFAKYLIVLRTDLTGNVDDAPSPQNAVLRASKSQGFSYYWGGGAWTAEGVTQASAGSCNGGGCPNCTHQGRFGADCSGMVAKAWQFGEKDLKTDDHPFGTVHFINPKPGSWSAVGREALKPGDALVHNNGTSGHIVLYEKGDGWNAPTVYECKGCAAGCVYNSRAFGKDYVGIRRDGF
jgi:hypothetical protein